MNRLKHLCALSLVFLVLPFEAHAQWAVLDVGNLAQNIMTAARAMQQVNNQILQLENEAQMLTNEAKNLHPLNFSVLADLKATLQATDQLIAQAQGLSFAVSQAEQQFATLYPTAYGNAVTGAQLLTDARKRWSNSLEALRTAIRLQAKVEETVAHAETALSDLVTRSQAASGALEATQSTNQLLALQIQQGLEAQQLRIAEGRAAAVETARSVAAAERARQVRTLFTTSAGPYSPVPVQLFGP